MNEEDLMYASKEDQEFYLKCVEGLPTLAGLNGSGKDADGIAIPYGLGSHSVRCLREIIEIVKPNTILEIGFNCGYSAALWMELAPNARLFTCDISYKAETIVAAEIMKERYKERFFYSNRVDFPYLHEKYDLIFIDGSHLLQDVMEDIECALALKIPYLAFDDIMPAFGFAQDAINLFLDKLEVVNVNGNIALYKNKTL